MSIQSGTRLGPYEILAPIGAGGMGEVYKARDTRLDRSVAVKILPAEFANDARLRARFEREAKAISQLNHPNICALYDVGRDHDTDFLVMELLEGETLADRLDRGALPLDAVLRHGVEIADALARAHHQGVIHRDLKPGNIMLTKGGAKLLDFGLAKTADVAIGTDDATQHRPLTAEGTVVGTFQYMSPEQLEGLEADTRSDIFALGTLLYEMATGRRAFSGKTRTSLIAAILERQPPPMSEIQPMTPPAFEHLVRKCLSKDPDDRWQSVQDVAAELRWIRDAQSAATPVVRRRAKREIVAWAVAIAALIAVAALAPRLWRDKPSPAPIWFTLPSETAEYEFPWITIVSPDGQSVAFMAQARGGQRAYWIRRLKAPHARRFAAAGSEAAWSPDGRSIVYFAQRELRKVDVESGASQTLAKDIVRQNGSAWSDDGTILFADLNGGLKRVSAAGGPVETATHPPKGYNDSYPYFLADGKRFVFLRVELRKRAVPPHALYAGTLGSAEVKKIGEVESRVAIANGYLLSARESVLYATPFDEKKLTVRGTPVPLVRDVGYTSRNAWAIFYVSRNGVLTYFTNVYPNRLAWFDRSGRQTPIEGITGCREIRISPDQRTAAMTIIDPATGQDDLWLYDLARNVKARLTFDPTPEYSPEWTPDGKQLLYTGMREGMESLLLKTIDGSREDELLLSYGGRLWSHHVSSDGKFVSYDDNEQGSFNVKVLPLSPRGKPISFAASPQAEEGNGRFSPDGRWMAYQSTESGREQVYVKAFPGPGPRYQISVDGGYDAKWKSDGTELIWLNGRKIMSADLRGGFENVVPRVLFEAPAEPASFDVTRDAQRMLVSYRDDSTPQPPPTVIVNWPLLLER